MKSIGLYIHIPFCQSLCHYCDFVKTARWSEESVKSYFSALERHFEHWTKVFLLPESYQISSIFFGGGTPSLFTEEYDRLFSLFRPFLTSDAEVSFEANPDNLKRDSLAHWKSLGVNRLSIGVQSFDKKGLCTLTRSHSFEDVKRGYDLAKEFFDSLNLDLIYGWSGQSLAAWEKDLDYLLHLDPSHVSLYLLTYASQTPMGRAYQRGRILPEKDELLENFYKLARKKLSAYDHEEVSNWSKKGKSCRHNWLYWQDGYYLALGAGACGYLPYQGSPFGVRYQYKGREKSFVKAALPSWPLISDSEHSSGFVLEERSEDIWLLEYIGASLRSGRGVCLKRVSERTSFVFSPSSTIEEALAQGLMTLKDSRIYLTPSEWFRESAWCLKIQECFSPRES